jgi:hypothetical protein
MTFEEPKRDRPSRAAASAWMFAVLVMVVGGGLAWIALAIGLCEDEGFAGTDAYCNGGGIEATGTAFLILAAAVLVGPAVSWAARWRRVFWICVLAPPVLAAAVVLMVLTMATK